MDLIKTEKRTGNVITSRVKGTEAETRTGMAMQRAQKQRALKQRPAHEKLREKFNNRR